MFFCPDVSNAGSVKSRYKRMHHIDKKHDYWRVKEKLGFQLVRKPGRHRCGNEINVESHNVAEPKREQKSADQKYRCRPSRVWSLFWLVLVQDRFMKQLFVECISIVAVLNPAHEMDDSHNKKSNHNGLADHRRFGEYFWL